MGLRDELIEFRAINNYTQKEVAEKIGVSREIIMRAESGTQPIRSVSQRKIELYLESQK